MTINVVTLCSGYDSQCMALDKIAEDNQDFSYELVAWSEIDKYAIKAHNAVYPQWADRNLGDMTKIDWSKIETPIDLLTYSTPCTDLSNAGLKKGMEEGSGTRSSILWYTRNAILALKPKYLMLENVKAMVSNKFLPYFEKWLAELESYGYNNYWQVCNAKNYGVPQNRERVFLISIRKDVDRGGGYLFPERFPLDRCLADILEQDVDESYYLSDERIAQLLGASDTSKLAGEGYEIVRDEE